MKKWTISAAVIVVAAVFAFAALAPGVSASEPGGRHGHGHNSGGGNGGGNGGGTGLPFDSIPGVLDANGDGIEAAAGLLNMHLCAADGLLLVRKADSTISDVTSTSDVDWLGLHVYFGFSGCVDITGAHAAALVVGTGLTLHAEGTGVAFLKGTGSYTNDGVTSPGSPDGVIVKIGSKLFGGATGTPASGTPAPTQTSSPAPSETPTATTTP